MHSSPPTPTARSLILDLLSTLRRGSMPVGALVGAGALFGLAANNVRVSLARLCAARLVERDERGRYRLGAAARAVDAHVTAWRDAVQRMRPWQPGDGWVAVQRAPAPARSRSARREEHALQLLGFRALVPGLLVRPDNLAGGVGALRQNLRALGLRDTSPVFLAAAFDAPQQQRALSLWDAAAAQHARRAALEALRRSRERLDGMPVAQAMVESFCTGGEAIRTIARDPLLPDALIAVAPLRELIDEMDAYDRAGRARWADFMASHGVHGRTSAPADLRMGAAAAALRAAAPPHDTHTSAPEGVPQ